MGMMKAAPRDKHILPPAKHPSEWSESGTSPKNCLQSGHSLWLECISYIDLLIYWLNLTVDFPLTFCHIEVRAFPLVNLN
jgi:hypothetical protein